MHSYDVLPANVIFENTKGEYHMKTTKEKRFAAAKWAMVGVLCLTCALGFTTGRAKASAFYCDDGIYAGEGESVSTTYTIEYDYLVEHNEHRVYEAPGIGNSLSGVSNYCSVLAGVNVVMYYDRFYPNLIPNFDPLFYYGDNEFMYKPDLSYPEVTNVFSTLYNYMNVNVVAPGATENDYKTGLSRYVREKGYNLSFTSFQGNSTCVDLNKVAQMAASNKVGVLFCNRYNFVYGISDYNNVRTVAQKSANVGHMMMVYGYFTVDYYKNGSKFLTETYLEVTSCYSSGDRGYVKMNDYLEIDDALIMNIS